MGVDLLRDRMYVICGTFRTLEAQEAISRPVRSSMFTVNDGIPGFRTVSRPTANGPGAFGTCTTPTPRWALGLQITVNAPSPALRGPAYPVFPSSIRRARYPLPGPETWNIIPSPKPVIEMRAVGHLEEVISGPAPSLEAVGYHL